MDADPAASEGRREPEPLARSVLTLLPVLVAFIAAAILSPLARESGDQASYLSYAQRLLEASYADLRSPWPVDYLWRGPGLPLLIAPLVALGAPAKLVRLVDPLLLWGAVVVFFRLASRYLERRHSLLAAYGLALYVPFYTVLGYVSVEPLAILLFTLVAFFCVRAARGARRAHLWAGLAFGLLALSRVEYGWTLLASAGLCVAWLVLDRRSLLAKRLATGSLVGLLCCAPWLAYTYQLTSKPLYWANSAGLSLYWMSVPTPGNLGDWHPPFVTVRDSFASTTAPAVRPNQRELARVMRLPPLEQDFELQRLALANIRGHPSVYLTNLVNNSSRLLFNFPYSFTRQSARPLLYTVPNAVLLGGVAVALGASAVARRRPRPEVGIVAALVLMGFAVHVPVSAFGRFTLPLVPATVWLALVTLAGALRPPATRAPTAAPNGAQSA